ncbi:MAG: hypothetical protein GVY20_15045 [Bacteroidetes bacterium]|nr:hypothetical protein [Bacteroidota bacterium]
MMHFLFPAEDGKACILWGRENRRAQTREWRSEVGLLGSEFPLADLIAGN